MSAAGAAGPGCEAGRAGMKTWGAGGRYSQHFSELIAGHYEWDTFPGKANTLSRLAWHSIALDDVLLLFGRGTLFVNRWPKTVPRLLQRRR